MYCVFDKITGRYRGGHANAPGPQYDSQTEVLVELPEFPTLAQRLDVATGQLVSCDPLPPPPNYDQLLTDAYSGCLAVATGTPEERLIEASRRMDQYPSFVTAAQRGNLALLQVVIARAHADYLVNPSTGISPAMEAAILAAMVANHVVEV